MANRVRMTSPFGPGDCHHALSNSRIERSISVRDIAIMLLPRGSWFKDPRLRAPAR